jgi:hypothetical protein
MQELPTRDQFAEQKGSTFAVRFGPESVVDMKLVEVTETKRKGRLESFSLLYAAPPDTPAWQNLFPVEHPVLGSMELFLVPVGGDAKSIEFEALFNLVVEPKKDYS